MSRNGVKVALPADDKEMESGIRSESDQTAAVLAAPVQQGGNVGREA